MPNRNCPLCGECIALSLRDYLKHVRLVHSDLPHFRIDCRLQGCSKTFKNFHTYRNHMYAFHKDDDEEPSNGSSMTVVQQDLDEQLVEQNDDPPSSQGDTDIVRPRSQSSTADRPGIGTSVETMRRAAAIMILKLREQHLLPQSVTEKIVEDIDSMYRVSTDY